MQTLKYYKKYISRNKVFQAHMLSWNFWFGTYFTNYNIIYFITEILASRFENKEFLN